MKHIIKAFRRTTSFLITLIGVALVGYSIWGFISLLIAEGWYSSNQGAFYDVLIGSIVMLIFGGGFIQLGLRKRKKGNRE